ncbi:zinc finger protein 862-like [Lasioglossum baleicum]|uniref:zinc finger protein 862-like n=1 Tax=Lasioglossum baleicum TaxID=434251 RepID=UPI003FCE2437
MDCVPAKRSKKRFQRHWFDADETLKVWLEELPSDESKCVCKVCNKIFGCGLTEIRKHSSTRAHQNNIEQLLSVNTPSGNEPDVQDNQPDEFLQEGTSSRPFLKEIRIAEIRYAAFFAENNIAISVAPKFLALMQDIAKNPAVLQGMKVGRTKCGNIISNVLCVRETERIVDNVRHTKFSVYEDETSDSTNDKWLSLMVRYIEPCRLSIRTELLQLIHLDASDCSAEKIFKSFENDLLQKQIPLRNIAALSCDNASVMMGSHSSFQSKLLEKNPNVVVMPCVCHSAALAATAACVTIPKECDDLLRGVASFVNGSPKRAAIFRQYREIYDKSPVQVLKLSETRWLARHQCVKRILMIWEDLQGYFLEYAVSEKLATAEKFSSLLSRSDIKGYFHFLDYVLDALNVFNASFQSRDTLVQELQPSSARLLHFFLKSFLKKPLLEAQVRGIDFSLESNQVPLNEVRLGPDTENHLDEALRHGMSEVELHSFRNNCLQFLITPSIVLLNSDRNSSFLNVAAVAQKLGNFSAEDLQNEWNILYFGTSQSQKDRWALLSFDGMWMDIGMQKNSDNCPIFPHLTSLVNAVRCLPHSNAEAERVFSLLPDIKNKKRNKLGPHLLNSICVVRTALKARQESSRTMSIDDGHLRLMSGKHLNTSPPHAQNFHKLTLHAAVDL